MSEFLVNLARRGAGLSPVIKPPASFSSFEAPSLDVAEMPPVEQEPVANQLEKTDEIREGIKEGFQPDPGLALDSTSARTWRRNSDSQSPQQRDTSRPIPANQVEIQHVEKGDQKIGPPSLEDAQKSMELTKMVQRTEAEQGPAMPFQVDPGQVQPAKKVDPLWPAEPLPSSGVETKMSNSTTLEPKPSQLESGGMVESGYKLPKKAVRIAKEQVEISAQDPQSSNEEKVRHDPEGEISLEKRAAESEWIKPKSSIMPVQQLLNTPSPERTAPTSVQVRIGTVEVRASQPPTVAPPQPTQPIGFSDFLRARLYLPETMD